jgi:hypothetical protein
MIYQHLTSPERSRKAERSRHSRRRLAAAPHDEGTWRLLEFQFLHTLGCAGPAPCRHPDPARGCRAARRHPFNRLAGRVASCSFLGRGWRLAVSVAGRDFRLDWHERVRAGESLAFSVAPEHCTIVPADGLSPAE